MQLWEEKALEREEERIRINTLNQKLIADNRTEDLVRTLNDSKYQEQLLKSYNL